MKRPNGLVYQAKELRTLPRVTSQDGNRSPRCTLLRTAAFSFFLFKSLLFLILHLGLGTQ
jgi:hypothetical protein